MGLCMTGIRKEKAYSSLVRFHSSYMLTMAGVPINHWKKTMHVSKQQCSHLYDCLHELKIHPDTCPEAYWASN